MRPHRELGSRLPWARFVWVLALVLLDLVTKSSVFAWLDVVPRPEAMVFLDDTGHWRVPLLGDWLALMPSRNKGAAFGRLQDWPHALVFGRIAAALVLTVLVARTRRSQPWVLSALVLVLAGALGNLYDNLFLDPPVDHPFGEVRDFIDVYFARWRWHFPTFNVADSCITVGAVLLLASSFGPQDDGEPGEPREAQSPE